MDEIQHEGELYISSKRASEITGYAKDYVGQLARGEKVKAVRVGRAWYVHDRSIREHAGVSLSETSQISQDELPQHDAKEPVPAGPHQVSVRSVAHYEPRVRTQSLNAIRYGTNQRPVLNTWSSVTYAKDESPLFVEHKIRVSQEENKPILKPENINSVKRDIKPLIKRNIPKNVDGITVSARPSGQRVAQKVVIEERRPSKSKHVAIHWSAQAFAVFFMFLVLGSLSLLFFNNEWDISTQTANALGSETYSFVFDFFGALFAAGVALIGDFLSLLIGSMAAFFQAGLNFILGLF